MLKETRAALRNALRQAVAALTAVEIDTEHGAEELIADLTRELGDRPCSRLDMLCSGEGNAHSLLAEAKKLAAGWPAGKGVLFLLDKPAPGNPEDSLAFWRCMNLRREGWGSLNCHVLFFLPTGPGGSFNLLLTEADHLADWMPLKFHLGAEASAWETQYQARSSAPLPGYMSPKLARSRLETLESLLESELASSPKDKRGLVRRYYLPMLEAALALGDLKRSRALRARAAEAPIPEGDRPRWWNLTYELDIELRNLEEASQAAKNLLAWAQKNKDTTVEAQTYHRLGIIAQEKRDFSAAEDWYKKSLSIKESQGNEHGAASTYHQLGIIAQKQRDLRTAEVWYKKSLTIEESQGDEYGAARTYHQLGMIAQEKRDFSTAEDWYRKSLSISESQGNEYEAARTYYQLGMIAQEKRDFSAAEDWYKKSLSIEERQGDEHGAAITLSQMGLMWRVLGDFERAGRCLLRGIEKFAACGDDFMATRAKDEFQETLEQAPGPIASRLRKLHAEGGP